MRRTVFAFLAALMVLGLVTSSALAAMGMKVTYKGLIIGLKCYSSMGMTSRAHGKTCGKSCLSSGLPAGILVKGHAWVLAVNPKALAEYDGLKAEVTGTAYSKTNVLIPTQIKVDEHGHYRAISLK